jgi:hypothetical protein
MCFADRPTVIRDGSPLWHVTHDFGVPVNTPLMWHDAHVEHFVVERCDPSSRNVGCDFS